MAYSIATYTGNGSNKNFSVSFPYISKTHVFVEVNGVSKTLTTDYTWLNDTTIAFVTAPANGTTVKIFRSSNRHARLVDYQDASQLTEEALDNDSNQIMYVAQEAFDAAEEFVTEASLGTVSPTASNISVTPTGNLGSNNVQSALQELQGDINTIDAENDGYDARLDALEANFAALDTSVDSGVAGERNRIINGAMRIDQYNLGAAINLNTNKNFPVDRWVVYTNSAPSGTITGQKKDGVTTDPAEYLRILRSSGSWTGQIRMVQVIESRRCHGLDGVAVTVTFKARKGSAYGNAGVRIYLHSGTVADQGFASFNAATWTGMSSQGTGVLTLTTSWQVFSHTFTVPASTAEVALEIRTESYTGSGTANDYLDISEVQMYAGTTVLPFEYKSREEDISLCRRYYQVLNGESTTLLFGVCGTGGANTTRFLWNFLTPMRGTPSFSTSGSFTARTAAANTAVTSFSTPQIHSSGVLVDTVNVGSFTAHHPTFLDANGSAQVRASAEL